MIDYTHRDMLDAYKRVGVEQGRVVYLTGNLGRLGGYQSRQKSRILKDHLQVIQNLLGPEGTLVVPTHTWSLCNTDTIFDLQHTESETGPFTEFVRTQSGAIRQFHPFSSSTALGSQALAICANTPRHVYGANSPFQRMVERDALYVSIGLPLERTISLVHHIELMMGVPYRYTKEFLHPCKVTGRIIKETFYLHVLRRDCDIERDRNRKIMANYRDNHRVRQANLGRSFVESLSSAEFFTATVKLFTNDIYAWLKKAPSDRGSYQR